MTVKEAEDALRAARRAEAEEAFMEARKKFAAAWAAAKATENGTTESRWAWRRMARLAADCDAHARGLFEMEGPR